MKRVQNFTLFIAAFLLLMVSCKKKDDNPAPAPSSSSSGKSRIYKISSPDSASFNQLFTYDDHNRISQVDNDEGTTQYFYDANGRLDNYKDIQSDLDLYFQTYLTYGAGDVLDYRNTYMVVPGLGSLLIDSAVYEYQQDRIAKIISYTHNIDLNDGEDDNDPAGQPFKYFPSDTIESEYAYDSRGNVIQLVINSSDGAETFTCTYDDKINYWSEITNGKWDPNFGPINVNNVVSQTYTGSDGQIDNSKSFTVNYTYNSAGYPVKGTYTWTNGVQTDLILEYK